MSTVAMKPILCLDFDGVIHSYTSGWKGADVIPDEPVHGAIEFIYNAMKYFTVAIYSSRSNQKGGILAMRLWLRMHVANNVESQTFRKGWLNAIEWPTEKPPAMITIDDRAITFTGIWPNINTLLNFKPWNEK